MAIKYVDNLSGMLRDRSIATRTREDIEYISRVRKDIDVRDSAIIEDWYDRYDDDNIKRAKRAVSKLETVNHDGETIHIINLDNIERSSGRMKEYMGVSPYTRKQLIKQAIDLPHSDRFVIGKEKLEHNFRYREVVNGISTHSIGGYFYSDADDYIEKEDKQIVLSSWDRLLKRIKK